jgi:hypothetical protein
VTPNEQTVAPTGGRPADGSEAFSLANFRPRYEANDNVWWVIECGHHQNLFDEACDTVDVLNRENARLREALATIMDCSDDGWTIVKCEEALASYPDLPPQPKTASEGTTDAR